MCCDPVSSPHIGPKESPEEATWAQFDEIYAEAGADFDAFEADDFDS